MYGYSNMCLLTYCSLTKITIQTFIFSNKDSLITYKDYVYLLFYVILFANR